MAVAGIIFVAGGLGAGLGIAFAGPGGSVAQQGGVAAPGPASSQPTGSTLAPQSSSSTNLVQLVANAVEPGVVDINTVVESEAPGSTQAAGTGMIISSKGLVLTNNHVINQAARIRVTIQGRSGSFPATVVGEDPKYDVAVIQIHGVSGLPAVSFGNSSRVTLGEGVIAIGNALGQGGLPTVVTGAVSALDRTITASESLSSSTETLHGMIQSSAPIQPGDSGGPLVNTAGQVIGMDTAAYSSDTGTTLGFSIPINQARAIASNIEQGRAVGGVIIGEAPFLGIFVNQAATAPAVPTSPFECFFGCSSGQGSSGNSGTGNSGTAVVPPKGVTISQVASGGPAAGAGLQAGDTITAIDGHATLTFTALHDAVAAHKPGDRVSVTYVTPSGATVNAEVTLAGLPA